jgi:branched-chain amino acid transport system substrate-binding protein
VYPCQPRAPKAVKLDTEHPEDGASAERPEDETSAPGSDEEAWAERSDEGASTESPEVGAEEPEVGAQEPEVGAEEAGEGAAGASGKVTRRDVLVYGGTVLGGAMVGSIIGYQLGSSPSEGDSDAKGAGNTTVTTVKIGAVIPKKAPLLGEGQETSRGLELAVKTINGRGGLGGKDVELVTVEVPDLSEATMTSAAGSFVEQEVMAVFLGFTSPTCDEFSVYAEYGAPVFHLSASQASLDKGADPQITNIFRCMPSPLAYGPRFAALLDELETTGAWAPKARSLAIVTTDDPDGAALADSVEAAVKPLKWKVTATERVATPVTDWEAVLSGLRSKPPGAIFLGVPSPSDLASFQEAFAADPIPSLVYETFGPSVPEYLELAGKAADGVVWSTPIGTIPDAVSAEFQELYEKKYKKSPGYSQAGAEYDMVLFWAQCAALAKKPSKFSQVAKTVPQVLYRGVSGTYNLGNAERVAVPYPDGTEDPSTGLPHLTFQIQGVKQVLLAPAPFGSGRFVKPDWV